MIYRSAVGGVDSAILGLAVCKYVDIAEYYTELYDDY